MLSNQDIDSAIETGAGSFLTTLTSQQATALAGDQPDSSIVNRAIESLHHRAVSEELRQLSGVGVSLLQRNPVRVLANASLFGFTLFGVGGTEYIARRYVSPVVAPLEEKASDAVTAQPLERIISQAIVLGAGIYVSASLLFGPTAGLALVTALNSEIRRAVCGELTHHIITIGKSAAQRMFRKIRATDAANSEIAENQQNRP